MQLPSNSQPFIVGSSGVEYALVKALTERGEIPGHASFSPLQAVKQTFVVSGSVSPTTERQIRHAAQNGFVTVPISAVALAEADHDALVAQTVDAALQLLSTGSSPLVHTALGTASDEGEKLNAITDARRNIGVGLGKILRQVVARTGLRRVMVAGGDSSSHALGQLDIYALTTRMPLPATPGSPLCTASSGDARLNGIEIALKGGQLGGDGYFVQLRDGKP